MYISYQHERQIKIGPIFRYSRVLRPFCPSPGSRCKSHHLNPRKQPPSPFRPIGLSLRFSERGRRMKSIIFYCSLVTGVYQWIQHSSVITNRRRNFFWLLLNNFKHSCELVSRFTYYLDWANAVPIAPTAFSCLIFLVAYTLRGLLRCLLSQLSRVPS